MRKVKRTRTMVTYSATYYDTDLKEVKETRFDLECHSSIEKFFKKAFPGCKLLDYKEEGNRNVTYVMAEEDFINNAEIAVL